MYWITFVGEGRSGHTIVSAILGSHPHIRLAEEQKYISKWCREPWDKERILNHLYQSGEGVERRKLGFPNILTYEEPLLAVGDKCGWDAVNEYRKRGASSDIITRFGNHMGMPVKTIVTVRNPFDNISAWIVSPKYQRLYKDNNLRFRRMIKRYKQFHDAANEIIKNQDVFYLYNEALISNPSEVIQELSDWLDLKSDREWRRYCASRVFKKPNKRSETLNWPEVYRQRVLTYINDNELLARYR